MGGGGEGRGGRRKEGKDEAAAEGSGSGRGVEAGRKGTGSRGVRERKKAGVMENDPEDIARVSGLVWMGRGQPLDPRASDGVGCTIRVICPRTNQNAVRFYDHLNWS